MERREQSSLQMLQIICIFLKALSPCCLAIVPPGLHSAKLILMLSYYWNTGTMLHAGFVGIKSILWVNLGT